MRKFIEFFLGKDFRRVYFLHRRVCDGRYRRFHRDRSFDVKYEQYWDDRLKRGY